jgi:ribonuclease R
MPKPFSERILRFLAQPGYRPVKIGRLERLMGIAEEEAGDFREAVDALRRVGRVIVGSDAALTLPQTPRRFIGVFRSNPRGFGFVVPENPDAHADLFIPPGAALDATTGDTVECEIEPQRRAAGPAGRIIRVIQRGHNRFVGELCHEHGRWYVRPDGNRLHVPIFVADAGAKAGRAGDQVVVEILTYPAKDRQARGVIVERLGKRGQPGVDLLSIIREHQLPCEFSDEALEDARRAVSAFDPEREAAHRDDLRGETIITIDPDDARDFDDAISLRRMPRGRGAAWELGVHIADVSSFVRPGTRLDDEARQRGNSVYFPRHVIPMLPETISNGVCSLQEGEPRLCKSAFIEYDAEGEVVSARFANTIIQSAKRLTYRQASGILDGRTGGFDQTVVALMHDMNTLARAIQKRRADRARPAGDRAGARRRQPRHRCPAGGCELQPHHHRDVHGGGERGRRAVAREPARAVPAAHPS